MSDDDKEKEAVRFDNPSLVNVRVLIVETESENEIADTKLFGFVVSVNEELIVSDVAVDDKEIFEPAIKFEGPNGTYPSAFVMLTALNAVEFSGVYPKVLII